MAARDGNRERPGDQSPMRAYQTAENGPSCVRTPFPAYPSSESVRESAAMLMQHGIGVAALLPFSVNPAIGPAYGPAHSEAEAKLLFERVANSNLGGLTGAMYGAEARGQQLVALRFRCEEDLAHAEFFLLELPQTWKSLGPTGDVDLWFRMPRNGAIDGAQVESIGAVPLSSGMIVTAPPSRSRRGTFRWLISPDSAALAELPRTLTRPDQSWRLREAQKALAARLNLNCALEKIEEICAAFDDDAETWPEEFEDAATSVRKRISAARLEALRRMWEWARDEGEALTQVVHEAAECARDDEHPLGFRLALDVMTQSVRWLDYWHPLRAQIETVLADGSRGRPFELSRLDNEVPQWDG